MAAKAFRDTVIDEPLPFLRAYCIPTGFSCFNPIIVCAKFAGGHKAMTLLVPLIQAMEASDEAATARVPSLGDRSAGHE